MRISDRLGFVLTLALTCGLLVTSVASAKVAPTAARPASLAGVPRTAAAVPSLERDGNLWRSNATGAIQSAFLLNEGPFEGGPEAAARAFLAQWADELGITAIADLRTEAVQETPGGWHVRLGQMKDGVAVYRADVVVSLDETARWVRAVQCNYDPFVARASFGAPILTDDVALGLAAQTLGLPYDAANPMRLRATLTDDPRSELLILRDGDVPGGVAHLAYRVFLAAESPAGDWVLRVDAQSGQILSAQDERVYVDGSGYTFDPDPLTTAGVNYGGSYVDGDDADTAELNAERVMHTLPSLTYNGSVYLLQGPYCKIIDFESPTSPPVNSADPDGFTYTRNQQGFEDVNVYYHIDASQRHIQSLGFYAIQSGPITCDPHGVQGQDNSYYSGGSNRIAYGEGGVDDAEDMDVIVHEYGHAIQHAINSNWGGGEEGAMGEGFGDYWAGSHSAAISTFHQYWVFNWDGHNPFWSGRVLNTTKTYPGDLNGSVHDDGEIWSAPLFQSWHEIGREVMDKLVLKGHYYLGSSATMTQGAAAIMQADLELCDGLHAGTLDWFFTRRGMFGPNDYVQPVIAHAVLGDQEESGPFPIVCTVTSTVPLVAGSIKVVYGIDGTFDHEMVLAATGNPNEYAGEIASLGTDIDITYYIKAKNTNGWHGTSPRGAEYTHHTFHVSGFSAVTEEGARGRLELGVAPNPSSGPGEIRFSLPARSQATLTIFDPSGRVVRTFRAGELAAGAHTITWDGRNDLGEPASPGVYFARLQAGDTARMEKFILAR
jgi:hypothetical protein